MGEYPAASPFEGYRLSPAIHNRIFSQILEMYTSGLHGVDTPRTFVLGGQPGCGKTALTVHCHNSFSDDNVCVINGDELRAFHPKSNEILEEHEDDYAAITDMDVRGWTSSLLEAARRSRFNIIFEGTMRTQEICKTLAAFKHEGYSSTACVIAAPAYLTIYSICRRYCTEKVRIGYGRKVDFRSHDAAYTGMLKTVDIIQDKNLAKIQLFCRSAFSADLSGKTIARLSPSADIPSKVIQSYREKTVSFEQASLLIEMGAKLSEDLCGCGCSDLAIEFEKRFRNEVEAHLPCK